ncbi:MAG: adenosylcobinamide amidohydrolase [Roseovarius sp.]
MSAVTLARPWLEFDLGGEMRVLSWAVNRPGLVGARRILWREVRNADLTEELDVEVWLEAELLARGAADAVTFLTSCDIGRFRQAEARVGGVEALALATVGLSNAERVGHRLAPESRDWGTINVALRLSCGLTEAAMLEAMSIATQARTAAVMEAHLPLAPGPATGTGTDCVAVAAPEGAERYAGLHTEIGEAVGRAVYTAVREGARDWLREVRKSPA